MSSKRPMGYIYPKRIQQIIHGETPVTTFLPTPNKYTLTDETLDVDGTTYNVYTFDGKKYIKRYNDVYVDIRTYTRLFNSNKCSVCNAEIRNSLDEKFYTYHKKCFKCVIKEETELRAKGLYNEYENKKIKENMKSYFSDVRVQMKEYLDSITDKTKIEYITETGGTEEWTANFEPQVKFFTNELAQLDSLLELIDTENSTVEDIYNKIEENKKESDNKMKLMHQGL